MVRCLAEFLFSLSLSLSLHPSMDVIADDARMFRLRMIDEDREEWKERKITLVRQYHSLYVGRKENAETEQEKKRQDMDKMKGWNKY